MQKEEQFFYAHAGFSYAQGESPEGARVMNAHALAQAEQWATRTGYAFKWTTDDEIDSSDFLDEKPAYKLWLCVMEDSTGELVTGIGAVDFGRDGEPWGDNYRRVLEAEMALEIMMIES